MSVTVTLILNHVQEIQGASLRGLDAGSSPAWRRANCHWAVTPCGRNDTTARL